MKRKELLLYILNINCFKIAVILSKLKIIFLLFNIIVKNATNHLFFNYFQWYKLVQI